MINTVFWIVNNGPWIPRLLQLQHTSEHFTMDFSALQIIYYYHIILWFKESLTPVRRPRNTPRRDSGDSIAPVPTAREKVLQHCGQDSPIPFSQCFTSAMLKKCVKIGEGVYGEVFKTERNRQSVALKVRKQHENHVCSPKYTTMHFKHRYILSSYHTLFPLSLPCLF